VLVAVNDHPELRAPIPDVIVAGDAMAEKAERADQRVTDHGGADMTHVHRLGDVWRRKVDDENARLDDRRNVEPTIVDGPAGRGGQPPCLDPQVDEPRPCHFRRLAQIVDR
jgi:hypothetical protein